MGSGLGDHHDDGALQQRTQPGHRNPFGVGDPAGQHVAQDVGLILEVPRIGARLAGGPRQLLGQTERLRGRRKQHPQEAEPVRTGPRQPGPRHPGRRRADRRSRQRTGHPRRPGAGDRVLVPGHRRHRGRPGRRRR
ncbi:hypothetical protein ACU686_00425 [Yinghuangia aomiensis]